MTQRIFAPAAAAHVRSRIPSPTRSSGPKRDTLNLRTHAPARAYACTTRAPAHSRTQSHASRPPPLPESRRHHARTREHAHTHTHSSYTSLAITCTFVPSHTATDDLQSVQTQKNTCNKEEKRGRGGLTQRKTVTRRKKSWLLARSCPHVSSAGAVRQHGPIGSNERGESVRLQ